MSELAKIFAENTAKLGTLAAALGLAGDEPLAEMQVIARQHTVQRAELILAARNVIISTQESMGQCFVPPEAMQRLRVALENLNAENLCQNPK